MFPDVSSTGLTVSFKQMPAFAKAMAGNGGGRGIRTLDTLCSVCRFSKPVVSATHPSLRAEF